MKRYFYLSDDLDDLEVIEEKLEEEGVSRPQIHVISKDDVGLDKHKLHQVHQWFQTDVVHSTLRGAVIGVLVAASIILICFAAGLDDAIGGLPFIFLSIVLLGFCTWEAGFIGTQLPNRHYKRFNAALENGQHLLMVDIEPKEEEILHKVASEHPELKSAGVGGGQPRWTVFTQKKARDYAEWAP